MLKAISQITDAEKSAQQLLLEAQQKATSLKADAKKDGLELLSSLKQEALIEYKDKISSIKDKSDAVLNKNKETFSNEANVLMQSAKTHFDDAVDLVVERIVSGI